MKKVWETNNKNNSLYENFGLSTKFVNWNAKLCLGSAKYPAYRMTINCIVTGGKKYEN